jgi:uncharacterized protein
MLDQTKKLLFLEGGTGPGEIGSLSVRFVIPDAGPLGRDRNVTAREATHAKVEYMKDGKRYTETLSTSQATAMVEQAQRDQAAAESRADDEAKRRAADDAEAKRRLEDLACPICGGRDFEEEISRQDSQWGYTTMRMKLLICKRCTHVLHFALGRSFYVPG